MWHYMNGMVTSGLLNVMGYGKCSYENVILTKFLSLAAMEVNILQPVRNVSCKGHFCSSEDVINSHAVYPAYSVMSI